MTITSSKRWQLVNRKSGLMRTSASTRDTARVNTRPTERIFDNVNQVWVR